MGGVSENEIKERGIKGYNRKNKENLINGKRAIKRREAY